MEYIEIDKDLIPYRFAIDLADEEFEIEINHNDRFDFFTIDLYKNDEVIVIGEKLMLDRELFSNITDTNLPKVKIVPRDRAGIELDITYDNLESAVFLYVG